VHVRNQSSQVASMAVVIATGITATGGREVLGLDVGDSEDEVFWRGFLKTLGQRGLSGVRLVISDQHAGLVAALRRTVQGASHQRCRVHFARRICWRSCPSPIRTWSPPCSAPSSPNPTPTPWPPPGIRFVTNSLTGSPRSAH
jgi:hypothetical protein